MKTTKKYTLEFLDPDGKKTKEEFISLLKAREIASGFMREGRFVSLKNAKSIPLPI